ncbi:MAG: hypothetical protein GVY18_01695 [Bacteroidetes bacterium]|jgi:hypothetical protein|nr:hypothetical protein [Bacteroidota bacterium]
MKAYRITKQMTATGALHLDGLPFAPGEYVEVIVLPSAQEERELPSLGGTLKRYDRPTDPVAAEDWDALQ